MTEEDQSDKDIVFQLDARELNHHTAIRLLLDLFDRGLNVDAASFKERWHIEGYRPKPKQSEIPFRQSEAEFKSQIGEFKKAVRSIKVPC